VDPSSFEPTLQDTANVSYHSVIRRSEFLMYLFLTVLSGLAWTVVYIDCVRIGLKSRTYAIPAAALALNFAWEATYAAHGVASGISVQGVINLVWAVLDVVIIGTFIRFGRAELPAFVTRPMFAGWSILLFGGSFVVQWLFIGQFGWRDASAYSAFLQNLLMSGLFVAMFAARGGSRGQTLLIAVAKWLGTLAPTVLFGYLGGSTFVIGIGSLCCVFDLGYLGLLTRNHRLR
jgi:hypothetical protein